MAGVERVTLEMDVIAKVDGAIGGINKIKNTLQGIKMPPKLGADLEKSFSNLGGLFEKYKDQVKNGFNTKGDVSAFAKTAKQIDSEIDRLSKNLHKLSGEKITLKIETDRLKTVQSTLDTLIAKKEKLMSDVKGSFGLDNYFDAFRKVSGGSHTNVYKHANMAQTALEHGNLDKALQEIQELNAAYDLMKQKRQDAFKDKVGISGSEAISTLKTKVEEAAQSQNTYNQRIETTRQELESLPSQMMGEAAKQAEQAAAGMDKLATETKQVTASSTEAARATQSMSQQLQDLQHTTQYFFSLRNMINLFKRGVDSAVQSVKELDAAMTETAVVTNFSVGDMWEKLPEYTSNANKLGATIQDMYESTTLYYQQGLNTEQAMTIASETMKMARIAGMEAAEATDMMTAALRGFNMEINEVSAQRINDVYSQLAAKTASNTEELGTAMQRTASIAHSAGMSFEGTAAFLAQAIETTREPAENLGTAMKTIVARFQEMKKNPLELVNVDGEEVSYNKVDAALQSIGVSLKDTNGQFRELDQVFLDISQRWDSLSQTQQRYIATIAAGSRQQSRFIAMMSNYGRTMELMDYANNSAGASQEQFSKTMESLEAKLNKLHNAWQEFTMGIANNSMIKAAVDGVTGLLNVTNKLLDKLSFGSGPLKSVLSLLTAFTGLKMAGRFANSLIGGLGGLLDPSIGFGKGFKGGAIGANNAVNTAQAQAISNPIVQAIHQLQSAMTGKLVTNNTQTTNNTNATSGALFKQVNEGIRKALSSNKLTGSGLVGQLNGLDKSSQRLMMANLTGTQHNINQNLLGQYSNSLFASSMPAIKQAFKNIDQQVAKESISFVEGYEAKVSPQNLLKHLDINNANDKALIESISKQMKYKVDDALTRAVQDRAAQQGKTLEDNELKAGIRAYRRTEEGKATARQAIQNMNLIDPQLIRTPMQQAMDNLGKFGAGLTSAGITISTFGNVLASSGIPGVQTLGAVISKVGSGITVLGTLLSSAAMSVIAFTEANWESAIATKAINFIKNPITIAVAAVAAALMALSAIIKLHNKKIKEEAEQVTTTYNEKTSKAKENINTLKQYREELARLSEGVDENGFNVSLDTTDYERYREIVNSIAEINPNIVQGYNAQGDAIIDNNNALEETLRLQEQINKQATDEYINSYSLDKLIKARDLDKIFNDPTAVKTGKDSNAAREAAKHLVNVFKNSHVQDEFLEQFGLTYDELASDEHDAISRLIANHDVMMQSLQNRYRATGRELSESLIEGFGNLSEAYDAQEEALQPIYDNLLTYANSNNLTSGFTAEMTTAFNKGLKTIVASQGSKGADMQKAAKNLSKLMKDVTGKGSKYSTILKDITKEQKEWAHSLDDNVYKENIQGSVEELQNLAEEQREAANSSDDLTEAERAAAYAMADFLDNQAAKALAFTDKSLQDLSSTFDQFSSSVKEAAKAYEHFEERMEGVQNYDEGLKSYKQIYDKIFEETEDSNGAKHQRLIEGVGQPEFWVAAESFFTSDWLYGDGGKSVQEVVDKLKEIGPALEEGEAGAIALGDQLKKSLETDTTFKDLFGDYFSINSDGSIQIAKDIPEEVMHDLANYWDILDEVLIAQFDNIRQFVPEFTFASSNEEIRTALAADSRTITGPGQQKTDENAVLLTTKDVLVDAFHEGNVWNTELIADRIDELAKDQQIYTLPELTLDKASGELKLTNDDRKFLTEKAGINASNFIDTLAPLIPDKSELETYASEFFQDNGAWWEEKGSELYDNWSANQANLIDDLTPETGDELPTIASSVSNIEAMMTTDLYRSGQMEDTSSLDQMHRAIFGNEGWDTSVQKLKHGANIDMTQEEFNQYYADAKDAVATLTKTKNDLEEGLSQATIIYGQNSEQVQRYNEAIAQVNQDLEYAKGAMDAADEYSKTKTWEYNDPSIQQHVNDVIAAGWGNLLSGVSAETLATPEAQQAMKTLASNTFDPDMVPTEEITSALNTLGIEWKDAALSGMDALHAEDVANSIAESGAAIATDLQKGVDEFADGINGVQTPEIQAPMTTSSVAQGAATVGNIATEIVAATVTVDTSESDAKLAETKDTANEVASVINQGAVFTISVPGLTDLNTAAKSAQSIGKNAGKQTVGVTTSFDKRAVVEGVNIIKGLTPKMQVGAETKPATDAAEKARGIIDGLKATIDVAINQVGSQTVNIVVKKSGSTIGTTTENLAYKGVNNKISYYHVPLAGSVAAGTKKGRVGPRNQGGMTLTGELGYEIAWLPSENRSVILGANGPQMINLPKDATVYNHEQSKEIMKKRRGIDAGSMWGGGTLDTTASTGAQAFKIIGITNTKTKGGGGNSKIEKEQEKLIAKGGKVIVWWDNQGHIVDKLLRNADRSQKLLDKLLKKTDITLDDISKDITQTMADYKKSIEANQTSAERAGQELQMADKGTQAQQDANAAYDKANTKKNRDTLKKLKEQKKNAKTDKAKKAIQKKIDKNALTKAKKARKEANEEAIALGTSAEISYEMTKKTTKKGKTKTSKVTKKANINMSKYIMEDPNNPGTYILNEEAISDVAKKNKSKAEAIRQAGNKIIDDKTKKKEQAEDNIEKAQEALDQLGQEIYDTFFGWEIELTKIWNITQQIEELNRKIARRNALDDLITAQTKSGMLSAEDAASQTIQNFSKRLGTQLEVLSERRKAINQTRQDLTDKFSGNDLDKIIKAVNDKLASGTLDEGKTLAYTKYLDELKEEQKTLKLMKDYAKLTTNNDGTITIDFDTETFESARTDGKLTGDEAKAIQDLVKEFQDGTKSLDDLLQAQPEGLTELFNTLNELNDQWADYEKQLIDINEEANRKEIEQIKKLSDSIKKSMDDLLNEVKHKLDERRKQEDNRKTEQDLSKKQQRLAMLRADTSGGHQLEIAQLEQEIADAQQSYQRTLEDQLLEKLQNQSDEAAKQRERQIALQEELATTTNNIAQVQEWMANPSFYKKDIKEQYRQKEHYYDTGKENQEKIDKEFEEFFSGLLSNRELANAITDGINSKEIQVETKTVKNDEDIKSEDNNEGVKRKAEEVPITPTISQAVQNFNKLRDNLIENPTITNYAEASRRIQLADAAWGALTPEERAQTNYNIRADRLAKMEAAQKQAKQEAEKQEARARLNSLQRQLDNYNNEIKNHENRILELNHQIQATKDSNRIIQLRAQQTTARNNITTVQQKVNDLQKQINELKAAYSFKKGGLANFTGPAWLDGTPSKPELILNSTDTKNFIALKDILDKAINSTSSTNNLSNSDTTYEININVDHIANDYDVDKMAERIKKIIVKDASYRNVTQVRNFR